MVLLWADQIYLRMSDLYHNLICLWFSLVLIKQRHECKLLFQTPHHPFFFLLLLLNSYFKLFICFIPGYWSMYLIGVQVGHILFFSNHSSATTSSKKWTRNRAAILSLLFWYSLPPIHVVKLLLITDSFCVSGDWFSSSISG